MRGRAGVRNRAERFQGPDVQVTGGAVHLRVWGTVFTVVINHWSVFSSSVVVYRSDAHLLEVWQLNDFVRYYCLPLKARVQPQRIQRSCYTFRFGGVFDHFTSMYMSVLGTISI